MKLAELVRAWRCHHEMSYREAAEKIGIPESVLRRFERGETVSGPTLLALIQWAISVDEGVY
jgi:ribosome-binding protein aMBF1 (putative translation factor)